MISPSPQSEKRISTLDVPWIYYVGPGLYGRTNEPIYDGINDVANVVSFLVYPNSTDRIRAIFGQKQMRTEGALGPKVLSRPRSIRALSSVTSRITSSTYDKIKLRPKNGRLPHEPDLIFVYDIFRRIADLSEFSCPKAYWVGDPTISIDRYFELGIVDEYDYVFVAQKDFIKVFKERGCKNVRWFPFGFDPRFVCGPQSDKIYDVSFVGSFYWGQRRASLLTVLRQRLKHSRTYIGQSYLRDMGLILRSSKIALQISVGGILGQRVFEVLGAGPLLIADRVSNGLLDLFEEKVHLTCYSDEKELIEKIEYYLREDEERKRIARAGQIEALSKHTYTHRAIYLVRTCLGRDLTKFASRWLPWFRDDFLESLV